MRERERSWKTVLFKVILVCIAYNEKKNLTWRYLTYFCDVYKNSENEYNEKKKTNLTL